jgi:AraC-like DNA-binding protein
MMQKEGGLIMNTQDVCKFIPSKVTAKDLNMVNFVYECKYFPEGFQIRNTYIIHLVSEGHGILHTWAGQHRLEPGDMFFVRPQQEFRIENTGNIHFLYISYLGIRANALMERLAIHSEPAIFHGQDILIPMWKQALRHSNSENLDLITEGLLLYSLAQLCQTSSENIPDSTSTDIILKVKQFVEEHFHDPDLTLHSVAAHFGYNHKYISQKFSKTVAIGFNNYLQNLRIQHAQKLIESGIKNVSEISIRCGYRDPLYFSRLYKEKTGQSPKQHIMKRS